MILILITATYFTNGHHVVPDVGARGVDDVLPSSSCPVIVAVVIIVILQ